MVYNPRAVIAVCLAAFAAPGCASNPAHDKEALQRAEAGITQADGADTGHTESATLQVARQKLDEAKQAQSKGDHRQAERLARQAELQAQLASARAQATSSEKAATELRAGVDALRQESARGSAAAPATTGTVTP